MAIKFPSYDVLVYIRTYTGSSVEFGKRGSVYMKDSWNSTLTAYPAQGVVSGIKVQDNMHAQFNKIEQLFPKGSTVFFIGNPYAGSEGTVLDPMLVYSCGRIQGMLKASTKTFYSNHLPTIYIVCESATYNKQTVENNGPRATRCNRLQSACAATQISSSIFIVGPA